MTFLHFRHRQHQINSPPLSDAKVSHYAYVYRIVHACESHRPCNVLAAEHRAISNKVRTHYRAWRHLYPFARAALRGCHSLYSMLTLPVLCDPWNLIGWNDSFVVVAATRGDGWSCGFSSINHTHCRAAMHGGFVATTAFYSCRNCCMWAALPIETLERILQAL